MNNTDLYLDYDHPARSRVMCASIAVGACIGALAEFLGYPNPAPIILCFVVTCVVEIVGEVKYAQVTLKRNRTQEALPVRRLFIFSTLSAVVSLVLVRLHIPQREADASEQLLEQASVLPTDPKNIEAATEVLTRAQAAGVQISPVAIEKTGRRFVNAANQNPKTWDAALNFLEYKSFINSFSPALPPQIHEQHVLLGTHYAPNPPLGSGPIKMFYRGYSKKEDSAQFMQIGHDLDQGSAYGLSIFLAEGGGQILDGMQFKNVVFRDVRIVYNGGPVRMNNVYFVNCTFEMRQLPNSQNLALAMLDPSSATTFSGV
jgi:hypothetical protein